EAPSSLMKSQRHRDTEKLSRGSWIGLAAIVSCHARVEPGSDAKRRRRQSDPKSALILSSVSLWFSNPPTKSEHVPELGGLGAEIVFVVAVGGKDMRHPLDDGDAAVRQRGHLLRVVRHQPDPPEPQAAQHLR